MTLVLSYIARSDRGLVRSNNEDSFYAGPRLLALADGMGGHAAGEVASQLVIQSLRGLDDDEPGGDVLGALDRATHAGNRAIAEEVDHSAELEGMGTTLTAILFSGNRIGLCHIGDSRGYLYRDGAITQITRDDTYVQTLVDDGRITAEEAHNHPQRSLIMRALTGTDIEPTLTMREARAGDRYLLCSDGLSDVVSEETIAETLGSVAEPKQCADRLIELALRGGGPDNVTVVLADVIDTQYGDSQPIVGGAAGDGEDAYTPDPKTSAGRAAALRPPAATPQRPSVLDHEDEEPPRRRHFGRWIAVGVVVVVIAALLAGYYGFRAVMRDSYYIGEQDGKVLVFQGSPDDVLFISVRSVSEKICVDGADTDTPSLSFAPKDSGDCRQLTLRDLNSASVNTVKSHGISKIPQDRVQNRAQDLEFRPLCKPAPAPPPAPARPGEPSPRPGQRPAGGHGAANIVPITAPPASNPASSPAASSPAPAPTSSPDDGEPCREP